MTNFIMIMTNLLSTMQYSKYYTCISVLMPTYSGYTFIIPYTQLQATYDKHEIPVWMGGAGGLGMGCQWLTGLVSRVCL